MNTQIAKMKLCYRRSRAYYHSCVDEAPDHWGRRMNYLITDDGSRLIERLAHLPGILTVAHHDITIALPSAEETAIADEQSTRW
jgi:hypothetical protein